MTTLQRIELECPVCGNRFSSQAVLSTNSFGGKRTDFHERAAGTQPLPYLVHMCDRCGYSGPERDFADEADASPSLKERVWSELAPILASGSGRRPGPNGAASTGTFQVTGSAKYEAAAKVAEWQSMEPRYIADFYLRAAWCCVDEGDVEAERYFRRHAAWMFERALEAYDGVARDERAVLTYLIGELWRRIGDLRAAERWFCRVPDEVIDPEGQRWVLDAARQQQEHPREWFG